MLTKFWFENLKGRDHSEDLFIDGSTIIERILEKQDGKLWTGCIWMRVEFSGWFL
jgi:hypothetical protein